MPAPVRILHLEDEEVDVELIQATLKAGGLACDVVHVTSREQFESPVAQGQARQSQDDYRTLVELSPDAIFIETEGNFAFLNHMAVGIFGGSDPTELLGKPLREFVHADSRASAGDFLDKLSGSRKTTASCEIKLLRLDGSSFDAEISAAPLTFEGKPAIQVAMRDISERKRAQEVMRHVSSKLAGPLKGSATREVVGLVVFGLIVFALGWFFNLFEPVFSWSLRHRETLLDEFLGALIVLNPALALFGYRRWTETGRCRSGIPRPDEPAQRPTGRPRTADLSEDLVVLALLAIVVFTIGHQFKLFEALFEWVLKYKETVVDELFGTMIILAPAFAAFAYRRWKETQIE